MVINDNIDNNNILLLRGFRLRSAIVFPPHWKPDGLMALCRRRVLSQLPWAAAAVSAAFAIGLLVVHVTFGCAALAAWGYFFGYYVLRSQSSPYPIQIRAFLATALLACTSVVTAAAWLFLGGLDGCRVFDPEMKTSFGYKFDQFWTLLCFRHAANWFLTVIGVYLVLADHPPSTYIRDCIRCLLYLYTSQIVATLGNTWIACAGADGNNDGVRDSFLEGSVNMQESLIAGLQVSGRFLLVLAGNWFLQIVVKMMRALEAAFEEPLPCFRTIVYLKVLRRSPNDYVASCISTADSLFAGLRHFSPGPGSLDFSGIFGASRPSARAAAFPSQSYRVQRGLLRRRCSSRRAPCVVFKSPSCSAIRPPSGHFLF